MRRLSIDAYNALTPEEWLARRRKMRAEKIARYRARMGKEERTRRMRRDEARCYDWDVIMPHVEVEESTGCWVWRGRYKLNFTRVTPLIAVGASGRLDARMVVWGLTNKKPLPPNCFLRPTCGRTECVAAAHSAVTNNVIERAKRRRAHHEQEGLLRDEQGRPEQRTGEPDDERSESADGHVEAGAAADRESAA